MSRPDAPHDAEDSKGERVLVLGGTGFLGRSLCRQLTSSGPGLRRVTVVTRNIAAADHLRCLPGLEVVQGDVFDPAQLAPLVERHDVVVNLIAILHGDAAAFRRVHVDLPGLLANVCKAENRPRLIHVSALGVGAEAPSLYLRSKTEGEACLKTAGIDVTVHRPSVMFGAEDQFLNLFARLLRVAPFFPLAGADARFQPVWVEDVAAGIVRCLRSPQTIGHVYECVGPRSYSLLDMVRLTGQWSGHSRPIFPLPAGLARVQASILERMPGRILMSRDNLLSMTRPNISTGMLPTLRDLGVAVSALESVAPQYLSGAARS